MKNTTLFILALIGSTVLHAQDPDPILFEDTWYLIELIVDGNIVEIPSNPDFSYVTLDIRETPDWGLNTRVCNSIGSQITDFTDFFFKTNGFAIFTYNCFQPSTFIFEDFYFSDFYLDGNLIERFTYLLETGTNTVLWLTIMNVNGDAARYGNLAALDVEEVTSIAFTLYPNPVSDKVFMQLSKDVIIKDFRILDLQGKLILQKFNTQTGLIEIDTSSLSSGLYFVEVRDADGQSFIERFVKN